MIQEISVKIDIRWIKTPTDCRLCSNCKSNIYSDMYVMWVKYLRLEETNHVLCASCFDTTGFKLGSNFEDVKV